jgi:hypothetical protein
VLYSLLGSVSIRLFGVREHDSMLEPIAYKASKVTTCLGPVLQWKNVIARVTQVLRPEILRNETDL